MAVVLIAVGVPTPAEARPGGGFAAPPTADRPFYRFWTTGGLMTPDSAAAQVAQMAAAGAGGVEYNQVSLGAAAYDPARHDWTNDSWATAMKATFDAGRREGLQADHIYTPGWSAGTTTVSPDGPGSDQKIAFARQVVPGGSTFAGPVPAPPLPAGVTKRTLQAAVAYRCVATCAEAVPLLRPGSAVDLAGKPSWTAPTGGTWVVIGSWMMGTGHTVGLAGTARTTYLVDHFSLDGINAVKRFWRDEVLTPELEKSIRSAGGSLFFDSLELNSSGAQVLHWTPGFLREFERRRGYSLVPYLPVVAVSDPAYDFPGDTGDRVREDYRATLNELFRDHHLKPLAAWAHQRGLTLRGQPYSSWGPSPVDMQELAGLLDVAEGEDRSFTSGSDVNHLENRSSDVWRALAASVAQAGHNLLSTECCAEGQAHRYPRATLLSHVNQQLVTGVNMIVWHGWGDTTPGAARAWPGFSLFNGGVADAYGPVSPTWSGDRTINDYVARLQTVLRRGDLRDDVAIYRQGGGHSLSGATGDLYFTDQSLARAGYTYGFMGRTQVADRAATVRNGKLLSLGYKAFVLNNTPNVNYETTLDLATATKILSWARAGLPVVIVGETPSRVRGLAPGQDARLRAVIGQLLAQRTVRVVDREAAVTGALAGLGVRPAASFAQPSPFLNLRRTTRDSDYYFFWNNSATRATSTVTLTGQGRPFRYDPWSGTVTPITSYTRVPGGVRLDISATSGNGVLVALTKGNEDTVRTTSPWISTGTGTVSPSWTLAVTSYEKGATPETTTRRALPPVALTGPTLPDWQRIAGLETVSGTAVYSTAITSPRGGKALLDLGTVLGTYAVELNGRKLPPADLMDPSAIQVSLRRGENTLRVHVATLLGNAAYGSRQPYGLIGPVRIH
ncbi:glycosyl hydrolase [Actinoplanes sp. NPDC000266]